MFRSGSFAGFFFLCIAAGLLVQPLFGWLALLVLLLPLKTVLGFHNSLERRDKRDVREGRHKPHG